MKKRTSRVSRRIVSLLMSMVLTLTLVTPAAFAEGDILDNGQQQEQQEPMDAGNGGSGDVNTPAGGKDSEDSAGKDDVDKNTEDGGDEQQPTDPGDEDKNPNEGDGEDANKPDEDNKGEEKPDEDNKDKGNKDEQKPTEDENDGEDEIALLNAENGVDVWDGTIAKDFAGGDGSKDDPYQISTGAELAYLAQQVNDEDNEEDYSDQYFKLTNDIRLNE